MKQTFSRSAFLLALLFSFLSFRTWADVADGSGLKIGANADIVGQHAFNDPTTSAQRLMVREAELIFYGPTDHLFDGRLSIAAHQEGAESFFEVHEAFFGSSKLIPRSRFRVGQMFLGIGRLNQTHRHDWPFISAPRYHTEFFGNSEEGPTDTGFEFSYLAPTPFYLDLTAGVTNGWVFGHAHTVGTKPNEPSHYLRAETFFSFEEGSGLKLGLNYLGNRSDNGTERRLLGLDAVAKFKEGSTVNWFIQSEFWYSVLKLGGASDAAKRIGMYIFPNYYLGENFFLGVRGDLTTQLNLENAVGDPISNLQYQLVPTLSYKPSEFTVIRLAFNYMTNRRAGAEIDRERMIEAQTVFILGAHPAHDF